MNWLGRTAAALFVFGCIAGAAGTARAATLDPFRTAAKGDRSLDPFRVAQALPLPPQEEKQKPAPAAQPQPATKPPTATPTPSSTPPAAAPAAKACQRDEDCNEGSICKASTCQPIELTTNLF